jgi:diadenylate cyclase
MENIPLMSLAFISIRWLDFLDILLVAILMYQLYNLLKGTVAIRILLGILSLYLIWKLVEALKMELLDEILGQFIGVGVIALIIVFQQEIRRFLLIVGNRSILAQPRIRKKFGAWKWNDQKVEELNSKAIIKACFNMSKSKTGALIVISKDSELKYHASTGDQIDGIVSSNLLETIFFKNNPMHDGGVIIHSNKIKAARCILPVSDNPKIHASYGLRHRAAVGITENSTAVAIIVSEETGEISFCKNGNLKHKLEIDELRSLLEREFKN